MLITIEEAVHKAMNEIERLGYSETTKAETKNLYSQGNTHGKIDK